MEKKLSRPVNPLKRKKQRISKTDPEISDNIKAEVLGVKKRKKQRISKTDPEISDNIKTEVLGVKKRKMLRTSETDPEISDNIKAKVLGVKGEESVTEKTSNAIQIESELLKSVMEPLQPKKLSKAVIKNVTAHQLNLVLNGGLSGRIHITELGCTEENVMPLTNFSPGMHLNVHIIHTTFKMTRNYLAISHHSMRKIRECSFKFPPPIPLDKKFSPGMCVSGFVKKADDTLATIWLSPSQTGTLDYLHFSDNPKVLQVLKKKLKLGLSLTVNILDVKEIHEGNRVFYNISLSKIEQPIEAGCKVVALVQIATPEEGVILKLPRGYRGLACLTDVTDTWIALKAQLKKFIKLRYIHCHVLKVNHVTKFCWLSLRKSRLFKINKSSSEEIYPELTVKDLEQGKTVKGIIKTVADDNLIVTIGSMLDGIASFHNCSIYGCSCKNIQNIVQKFQIGDVIDVVIEGVTQERNLYPLSLPQLTKLGVHKHRRLSITEDVDWDEL